MFHAVSPFLTHLKNVFLNEDGQDLVEYALLAGFITVAVGATFPPASNSISTIFSRVGSLLAGAA